MRNRLAVSLIAATLALPFAAYSQALPDEVRSAGVTVIMWQGVQAQVRRAAAEKHVSELALAGVCARMGVALARGKRFDIAQMISLIEGKADEINALTQRLTLLENGNDPKTAALLEQVRKAIDAGDLDQADALLEEARASARAALQDAQRKVAAVVAAEGQVKALRLDYLGAATSYAEAAQDLPAGETKDRWTYLDLQAAALQTRGKLFAEPTALRQAVTIWQDQALPLAPREPARWAQTESNLGVTLRILGDLGDGQALKDALTAFHAALEVRTREHDPTGWAETERELGDALNDLGERGDAQALKDAIAAYRSALEADPRDRDPAGWAKTEMDLGNALIDLGERGDAQALRDAVAAYHAALEVRTRERDPAGWAATQLDLGVALDELGKRGDDQALKDAVAAYRSALEVLTRDRDPSDWAVTQVDLGDVLHALGERGDEQAIRDAVAADRAALEVLTRDGNQILWAEAQGNLGEALTLLGKHGDAQALTEAIAAERLALTVFARDRYPEPWADAEEGLGDALLTSAKTGDDPALNDAVAAYQNALQVWTPAANPTEAKKIADSLARAQAQLAAGKH
jgi:tetratricopeptide (TPR) repeat protein